MTGIDYESEYNNRARVPDHLEVMEGWQRDAAAWRETCRCELDIAYELSPRTTYDLFLPEPGREGPRVIGLFVHGGYWQALDCKSFSHMAAGLVAHGIPVAVANYDLCPQVRIGDITEEIRRLTETLWDRFNRPVLAFGHSAGGHLTAELVATRWGERGKPNRLVPAGLALSGLFDLQPLVGTSINEKLRLDRDEAIAQSPITRPTPAGTRFTAAVGADESAEYLRQSRIIVDQWSRGGVDAKLDIQPGANHFTVIGPLARPDSALTLELMDMARAVG